VKSTDIRQRPNGRFRLSHSSRSHDKKFRAIHEGS
jgi:hypothetical protein